MSVAEIQSSTQMTSPPPSTTSISPEEVKTPSKPFEFPAASQKLIKQLGVQMDGIMATPHLSDFLKNCTDTLPYAKDFVQSGTDFKQMGSLLPMPGDIQPEIRQGIGQALAARNSECSRILSKWEHYMVHPALATHVMRQFAEQKDPGDKSYCSGCSSCHRYGDSTCIVSKTGALKEHRRAVVATVSLLYKLWQSVPPLQFIPTLYRLEDSFDGWGLFYKESKTCRKGIEEEKYPYDLHICKQRLLEQGKKLTLSVSMAFSNTRDVFSDPKAATDGSIRWQVSPPKGSDAIVGAFPLRTNWMQCITCNSRSVGWELTEVVLLPGSTFIIDSVSVDTYTTVNIRQI